METVALFTNYSITDILIFCVILALAIKGVVSFFDWAKARLQKVFDKDYAEKERNKTIDERIEDLEKNYQEKKVVDKEGFEKLNEALAETNEKVDMLAQTMNKQVDVLLSSDKEAIKSYITEKHHYFVYERGWIDDYNLECLSKRFAIYQEEHGNSFIEGLMDEIYDLPKRPLTDENEVIGKQYEGTRKYITKHMEQK